MNNPTDEYDICIIGSGAGGAPVAWSLARAGYSVLVLEKGPWIHADEFSKDEMACCRRNVYTPKLDKEQHVIEDRDAEGRWRGTPTSESGWSFWNGNCVGGSSNFMSGFFHRMKPVDFRLRSEFGAIDGANVVDWPIDYDELEPYYARAEQEIGISGEVRDVPWAEPRSTEQFPWPPTAEHPISAWIDDACETLGYRSLRVPRAILSQPKDGRGSCSYSGYCGSFGCSSNAKGSARAALLDRAVVDGRCEVRPHSQVLRLHSDGDGRISQVEYVDEQEQRHQVRAGVYVLAAQAIESARLLLNSPGPRHPNGLANGSGQVGRNLLFSAGGTGSANFFYDDLKDGRAEQLAVVGPFVNRALYDAYVVDQAPFAVAGRSAAKGGMVEFLFEHPNPTSVASGARWSDGQLSWGLPLKRRLEHWLRDLRTLTFEVFCDWLPNDDCFVAIDPTVRDRWGVPVARVRIGGHPHDLEVGRHLAAYGERVLTAMGGQGVSSNVSATPPQNLVAGGCRFGDDPVSSVLDRDCRAHEVDNLYVTDGSFMPTGGSVPYTWTIYANSFRVADRIIERLGGARSGKT
jgi:choline dehydrogenase-like flavoprotein